MDDVSSATWQLFSGGTIGGTYHISTDHIVSIRELVELICSKMSADFDEYVNVSEDRLGKDAAYLLDSQKIRSETGWKDEISLEHGIEACINWVDANLSTLKEQPMSYVHKP